MIALRTKLTPTALLLMAAHCVWVPGAGAQTLPENQNDSSPPALPSVSSPSATPPALVAAAKLRVYVRHIGFDHAAELDPKLLGWFLRTAYTYESEHRTGIATTDLTEESRPGIHLFITPDGEGSLRVFFLAVTVSGERRYLMRHIELPRGFDDVGLETAALVIHDSTEALWEGLDRADFSVLKASIEESSAPEPPSRRVRAELFYGYRSRGAGSHVHGPGFGATIEHNSLPLSIRLATQWLPPTRLSEGNFELTTTGMRVELDAGYELLSQTPTLLHARLGVALELDYAQAHTTNSEEPTWTPSGPQTAIVPQLEAALRPSWQLAGARLFLESNVTVTLGSQHYDIDTDGGEERWRTLHSMQPGFRVGATW